MPAAAVSLAPRLRGAPGDARCQAMRPPTAAGRRWSRVPRRHLGGRPRASLPWSSRELRAARGGAGRRAISSSASWTTCARCPPRPRSPARCSLEHLVLPRRHHVTRSRSPWPGDRPHPRRDPAHHRRLGHRPHQRINLIDGSTAWRRAWWPSPGSARHLRARPMDLGLLPLDNVGPSGGGDRLRVCVGFCRSTSPGQIFMVTRRRWLLGC